MKIIIRFLSHSDSVSGIGSGTCYWHFNLRSWLGSRFSSWFSNYFSALSNHSFHNCWSFNCNWFSCTWIFSWRWNFSYRCGFNLSCCCRSRARFSSLGLWCLAVGCGAFLSCLSSLFSLCRFSCLSFSLKVPKVYQGPAREFLVH